MFKNCRNLFLVFLLIFCNSIYAADQSDELVAFIAQASTESEVDSLLSIFEKISKTQPRFTSEQTIPLRELAHKIGYEPGVIKSIDLHGIASATVGEYETALSSFEEALALKIKYNDDQEMAMSYARIGATQLMLNNFHESIFQINRSIELWTKLDHKTGLAMAYNNIAAIYQSCLFDVKTSLVYLKKAAAIYEEIGQVPNKLSTLSNLAIALALENDIEEATRYYEKGNKLAIAKKDTFNIALFAMTNGIISAAKKDYHRSIKNIKASLDIFEQNENIRNKAYAEHFLAQSYKGINDHKNALKYGLLAKKSIERSKLNFYLPDVLKGIYLDHKALKNFPAALETFEHYQLIKDSLLQQKTLSYDKIISRFESERKELELDTVKAQNSQKIKRLISLLIVTGVSALIFLLLYLNQKKLRKKAHQSHFAHNKKLRQANALQIEKQKELSDHLNFLREELSEKNNTIESIRTKLEHNILRHSNSKVEEITAVLRNSKILTEADWDKFKPLYNQVQPKFLSRLKERIPNLTDGELRLIALLKLDLTYETIASNLGISKEGVRKNKYRLRKKLFFRDDKELDQFIADF